MEKKFKDIKEFNKFCDESMFCVCGICFTSIFAYELGYKSGVEDTRYKEMNTTINVTLETEDLIKQGYIEE